MAQNQSLSTQEVADILHVSKSTIYDLIRKGEIHSYKIGRKVRFTQEDVDAYIARSRHEHSTAPVQRIDTHSTLLTPAEEKAPEMIISGRMLCWTFWQIIFIRRISTPVVHIYLALKVCWHCIRERWTLRPAICMMEKSAMPPLCEA